MESMLGSLATDWSVFAILTKLLWLVQLGLIVHALRTGRPYWWLWLLIGAPVIGGAAYLLVEILPEWQSSGSGGSGSWKPRAWRIRDLQRELEDTDTVKLRLALAGELAARGKPAEACAAAEECLQGVFRTDPHTLACVARYRLEAGKYAEALAAIDSIKGDVERMLVQRVMLMRGRILVHLGRQAEAQELLRANASGLLGEERSYYLALSLHQSGHTTEARGLWEEIRRRFRRAGRSWRRTEKRWFKLAGERLKETAA